MIKNLPKEIERHGAVFETPYCYLGRKKPASPEGSASIALLNILIITKGSTSSSRDASDCLMKRLNIKTKQKQKDTSGSEYIHIVI